MKNTFNKKVFISWLWVALCSITIFVTIPVARTIQRFISNNWGRISFIYFVLFILALGFLGLFYLLFFRLRVRSASNYIWLFIVGGLYTYFTLKLWKIPEEAIHFLEYGLLGFFLFKALTHNIRNKSIYFAATLFALFIGTFDEIFQWIIPNRVWNFRDVGLNVLSGGLFQLAIWKVVRPKIISEKINANSLKIFSSVLASCLILLGLCASNTSQRVAFYTKRIPSLSFLQKEEPMGDFGYKYKDPKIGTFYSRLSPNRLQDTDRENGKEYAQILNNSINKKYKEFIEKYNPITNPFLHEFRVHAFRRDYYFKRGNKASDLKKKEEFYFIAYKENLILKRYFTQTLKNSIYKWRDKETKKAKALIDADKLYKSPVSSNLFTSFSEKTMWISILVLISFLVVINLTFPFMEKRLRLPRRFAPRNDK